MMLAMYRNHYRALLLLCLFKSCHRHTQLSGSAAPLWFGDIHVAGESGA